MSSKEVIELLTRLDLDVKNHMSVMDEQMISKVEDYMKQLKNNASKVTSKKEQASSSSQAKNSNSKPSKAPNKAPKGGKNNKSEEAASKEKINKPNKATGETSSSKQAKNEQNKDKKQEQFNNSKKRGKQRKQNQPVNQTQTKPQTNEKVEQITISGPETVSEVAKKLKKEPSEIIKKLMFLGVMATINQEIDEDVITLIAEEYGATVEVKVEIDEEQFELLEEEVNEADLKERPPVVTVMGHVDHGKTTLLDAMRETNVTASEAGGITQHIGAYQIDYNGKKITFLDTPGHEAFTTMRARGAKVTDIAIIVVAADDGVMPQTKEAINHAQAANVPMIIAINKMDKPDANPDRAKQELMELNVVPEEWGGDTIFVPISALAKEGLDDLMEMVLLVAEVEEFKANPDTYARGTVIEAELDKGKGPVATILVQSGTLNVGDPIVVGNTFGKVRAMTNDIGRRIKTAGPSTPVEITGLHDVPQAGDQFKVFEDEKKARAIGEARASKHKESERDSSARMSLDDLFKQIQEGDIKEINVIIKADVQGSAEALRAALEKIEVEGVKVKIIHQGVGAINESDISLATASNAIVIGFNVRPRPQAKQLAEQEKVDIRLHRIIYKVIEEIESAMKGMLDPEYEEKVIGMVEVRQTFKVSKVGTIAGSYVKEGKVTRDASVRLIRDGVVIHEGKIDVLKRFKDDVKEVQTNYECGITLENYNDIKEGDIIEAYVMEEIERK